MNIDILRAGLSSLKLHYTVDHLGDFIDGKMSSIKKPIELLSLLVNSEIQENKRRSIQGRMRQAKLGKFKSMVDFDWNWPEKIDRVAIERLFNLAFIEEPSNVILIGTAGLGKTMIAKNLAYQALMAGHSALFVDTSDLLNDLGSQETHRAFKQRLKKYLRPKVLVIDEVGYLSSSSKSADILFQVISKRYEKSVTIVTSNKIFKEWGSIFPGAGCISALIDRITHYSEIIQIVGKSYRLHESITRRQPKISNKKTKT